MKPGRAKVAKGNGNRKDNRDPVGTIGGKYIFQQCITYFGIIADKAVTRWTTML